MDSLKIASSCMIAYLTLLLGGCTGESLFGEEESDQVFVDIINVGDTRITHISFSIITVFQAPDSANELTGEGLSPGETARFEHNCFLGTSRYMHVKWENGGIRNYSVATPCGKIISYEIPQ
jgi:hypothetical protein